MKNSKLAKPFSEARNERMIAACLTVCECAMSAKRAERTYPHKWNDTFNVEPHER
jgi:hypothetical protein